MFNKDRISYGSIQAVERRLGGIPLHKNTFQNTLPPPKPNETSFVSHTEIAGCTYFHYSELIFGITVLRYSKNAPVSYTDPQQKQPDKIVDNRYGIIMDKRVHPYDDKSGMYLDRTNNIIVSNRSKEQYEDLLDNHIISMRTNTFFTSEQEKVILGLKKKYGDVNGQQGVLMPNMHLFSNHYLPPLHNPENFYTGWFSSKAKSAYFKANNIVLFVDDFLVSNNIEKPRTKQEWQQFLNGPDFLKVKAELDNRFEKNPLYNKNWSTCDDYFGE